MNEIPLGLVDLNKKYYISSVKTPGRGPGYGIVNRLHAMGFIRGMEVSVINHGYSKGSYVVKIGDGRIMLGAGLVHKIFVCENKQDLERDSIENKL